MMKIFYQVNNNDCGIAVTQTLIKHFFNREISREELYQESNLKEEGLSILDLELLNEKYGIRLESYSMPWEEFEEYETNDLFLLVISRHGEQHYTIAKKKKGKVTLFDPYLGKVIVSLEEMKSIWLDIFIKIIPKSTPKVSSPKAIRLDKPDIHKLLSLFFVNAAVLLLSLLNGYLIKYSMSHVFNNYDFSNLIKILALNIFCYLVFYFGELVESWLVFRHKVFYSTNLYESLMDSLKNKKNSYFRKLGKDQFLILNDHIDCISTYHSEYVNKLYISIFTLLIVSFFFLYISPYFIFLILFSVATQLLFWKLTTDSYHKYLPLINEHQNKGKRLFYFLERFLRLELNSSKLNSLVSQSKKNWNEEMNCHKELVWKHSVYSKLNSCINHLFYIVVFAVISYYVFVGSLNFGSIMMMHFLYFHLNKSLSTLAGYYGFKTKYAYSRQVYSQMLNVDSFEESSTSMNVPQKIVIKDLFYSAGEKIIFRNMNAEILPYTIICGSSGSGKTVLYNLIIGKLNPSIPSIYFDDVETSSISPSAMRELCIYQVSDSYISPEDLDFISMDDVCENLKNTILDICEIMNIDINRVISNPENLSSGQRQLVNILSLFKYKNKILLLDEVASHINIEARILIYKHLIPHLATSNFVVCSEHTPEIVHLFPHQIQICPQ